MSTAIGHLPSPLGRCAVVGGGRLGSALVASLPALDGPYGRGFDAAGCDAVLLAVPDAQIAAAAAAIAPRDGLLVGHCSGATALDALAPHEAFGVHPLMTVLGAGADLHGAGAAIGGSTPRALDAARRLAEALDLRAFVIADDDRPAYHAAASTASNFLIALEDAAEELVRSAGGDRTMLVPLVRATVENWARLGAAALTGPIARGDEQTVAAQRAAVAERAPARLELWDALADATRAMAVRA